MGDDPTYFLNAVVERNNTLQVRTAVFSAANLDSLLAESPAAITLAPRDTLTGERLLKLFIKQEALFHRMFKVGAGKKVWRVYELRAGQYRLHFRQLANQAELLGRQAELLQQIVHSRSHASIAAILPEGEWALLHEDEVRSAISEAVRLAAAPNSRPVGEAKRSERESLVEARKKMLDVVGAYTSEDLASAVASTTHNASQFAADQRRTGKLFGVRFGQQWLYPKFQFDAKRHTLPEMKAVLTALTPDEHGWDRLQWFLEPHESLNGRTPLDVWKSNRAKVIDAARTERWNGRD